eukprot:2146125-Pyramimonas_sp.AAC.2
MYLRLGQPQFSASSLVLLRLEGAKVLYNVQVPEPADRPDDGQPVMQGDGRVFEALDGGGHIGHRRVQHLRHGAHLRAR